MKEEQEATEEKNIIQIADISVATTKGSLEDCTKQIKKLLKDKTISNFLNNQSPLKRAGYLG